MYQAGFFTEKSGVIFNSIAMISLVLNDQELHVNQALPVKL